MSQWNNSFSTTPGYIWILYVIIYRCSHTFCNNRRIVSMHCNNTIAFYSKRLFAFQAIVTIVLSWVTFSSSHCMDINKTIMTKLPLIYFLLYYNVIYIHWKQHVYPIITSFLVNKKWQMLFNIIPDLDVPHFIRNCLEVYNVEISDILVLIQKHVHFVVTAMLIVISNW